MKELNEIQVELKAPKNQFNKFGNYKYRNCEDILEALKPLLKKHKLSLIINDELVLIGERYYVKATAKLFNDKDSVEVSSFARESFSQKGMVDSQLTGSTSTYARKYALNGLFLIDDTKDADSMDNSHKPQKQEIKNIKPVKVDASEDDVKFEISNCKTEQDLADLWCNLDKKDQTKYKDYFSARKQDFVTVNNPHT